MNQMNQRPGYYQQQQMNHPPPHQGNRMNPNGQPGYYQQFSNPPFPQQQNHPAQFKYNPYK